jgi:hypothetical protein
MCETIVGGDLQEHKGREIMLLKTPMSQMHLLHQTVGCADHYLVNKGSTIAILVHDTIVWYVRHNTQVLMPAGARWPWQQVSTASNWKCYRAKFAAQDMSEMCSRMIASHLDVAQVLTSMLGRGRHHHKPN